jgi:hypothetical protein
MQRKHVRTGTSPTVATLKAGQFRTGLPNVEISIEIQQPNPGDVSCMVFALNDLAQDSTTKFFLSGTP